MHMDFFTNAGLFRSRDRGALGSSLWAVDKNITKNYLFRSRHRGAKVASVSENADSVRSSETHIALTGLILYFTPRFYKHNVPTGLKKAASNAGCHRSLPKTLHTLHLVIEVLLRSRKSNV